MGQLDGKTAIITGSSRGIGAETAKLLAADGAAVLINYRAKAPRAKKIVAGIESAGGRALAVGADLTTPEGPRALVDAAVDDLGGLDIVVLNASGGLEGGMAEDYAMALNRDAQVAMVRAALPALSSGGRIVFVTSHQAHFITTHETMEAYDPIARSKRAGEDALRALLPEIEAAGVSLVVVSGDMIEGTATATLLERSTPGALAARREAAGKLLSVEEFAVEVARMVTAAVPSGHTEYAGGAEHFAL